MFFLKKLQGQNASSHFIILTSVRPVYGWRGWWTWRHVDRIMPVRRLYDVVSVEAWLEKEWAECNGKYENHLFHKLLLLSVEHVCFFVSDAKIGLSGRGWNVSIPKRGGRIPKGGRGFPIEDRTPRVHLSVPLGCGWVDPRGTLRWNVGIAACGIFVLCRQDAGLW